MKKTLAAACFLFALSLFPGQAFSRPYEDISIPPSKEHMEKVRQRVETFKMWKLTQSLDLDEQTASKLFPLINRYDRRRFAVEREMRAAMRELRQSVDTASEEELETLVRKLKDYHEELQRIQSDELKELRDMLSVRDFARFVIFRQDFHRDMKNMIAKARKKRGLPPFPVREGE